MRRISGGSAAGRSTTACGSIIINGYVPAQDLPGSPREKFDDRFPGALALQSLGRRAALRRGERRAVLEGHQSAAGGVVGHVWERSDRAQGVGRPVCGQDRTWTSPRSLNPITTSVNSATRAWTDANKNFVPDCDLGNFALNGECDSPQQHQFSGRTIRERPAGTTRCSTAGACGITTGRFRREVQHELTRGLSLTAGYYRNTGGYYRNTDSKQRVDDNNLVVGPADYDTYCITAPSDPRLPGGGGYQVCGLAEHQADEIRSGRDRGGAHQGVWRRTSASTTSSAWG